MVFGWVGRINYTTHGTVHCAIYAETCDINSPVVKITLHQHTHTHAHNFFFFKWLRRVIFPLGKLAQRKKLHDVSSLFSIFWVGWGGGGGGGGSVYGGGGGGIFSVCGLALLLNGDRNVINFDYLVLIATEWLSCIIKIMSYVNIFLPRALLCVYAFECNRERENMSTYNIDAINLSFQTDSE